MKYRHLNLTLSQKKWIDLNPSVQKWHRSCVRAFVVWQVDGQRKDVRKLTALMLWKFDAGRVRFFFVAFAALFLFHLFAGRTELRLRWTAWRSLDGELACILRFAFIVLFELQMGWSSLGGFGSWTTRDVRAAWTAAWVTVNRYV